jgi:hypothetical protein
LLEKLEKRARDEIVDALVVIKEGDPVPPPPPNARRVLYVVERIVSIPSGSDQEASASDVGK